MASNLTTHTRTTAPRLSRAQRAQILVATGKVHPTGRPGCYSVEGSKPGTSYRVEITAKTAFCTCPDFARQYERTHVADAHCYHAMAGAIYRRAIRRAFRPAASAPAPTPVRTLNLPTQGDRPVRVPFSTVAA